MHRHYPELLEEARLIQEADARRELIRLYFLSVGAVSRREVVKLFRWSVSQVDDSLDNLVASGVLKRGLQNKDPSDEWIALPELL